MIRKFLACCLAAAMCCSMNVTALAGEVTESATVSESESTLNAEEDTAAESSSEVVGDSDEAESAEAAVDSDEAAEESLEAAAESDEAAEESLEAAVESDETEVESLEAAGETDEASEESPEAASETESGTCGDDLTWTLTDGNLTISGTGVTIEDNAFRNNKKIGSVTITDSVLWIGNSAFSGCSNMTSLTLPDSVEYIDSYAFSGCSSLTEVTLPDSIEYIQLYVFRNCSSLLSVTLPAHEISLQGGTFANCSSLTSVTIPDGITSIPDDTFYRCSSLKRVIIPNSVTSIGEDAFYCCSSLTKVTIPDGVVHIEDCAFYGCKGLTDVAIPDSVTGIGDYAFYGCRALTGVTIPGSVTSIGRYAFGMCYNTDTGTYQPIAGFTVNCGRCTSACQYAVKNGMEYAITLEDGSQHTPVVIKAVPATYTQTGLTAGSRCSVCGKIIKAQTTAAKKVLAKPVISALTNTSTGVKVNWKKVTDASGYYVYNGTKCVKTITSGTVLTYTDTTAKTNGTKYTYKVYAYRTESGTTVKSAVSAAESCYFLSCPAISSVKNSSSKTMKVIWKKNSKAAGYQIRYVTGSVSKTVTVKGTSSVSKSISKLTKGKTYKVYVRAYKTVSGVNYYSGWSGDKSVTIRK